MIVWQSPSESDRTHSVQSRFEVVNLGNNPVRILSIESGCGCTRPRIEPESILPGKSGIVTVEATPFPVGEKNVAILLRTDSPVTPSVPLGLRLIGSRKPPFLLNVSGDLAYPSVESTKELREITVNTVETSEQTATPLPRCDIPMVRLALVSRLEKPYTTPGTVERTYTFRVHFQPTAIEKTIVGEVRIADPWLTEYGESLQISVKLDPAIRIAPSPVVLSMRSGNDEAQAEFLVLAKTPTPDLVIQPEVSGDDAMRVERLELEQGGRLSRFRASLAKAPDSASKEGVHKFVVRESDSGHISYPFTIIVRVVEP